MPANSRPAKEREARALGLISHDLEVYGDAPTITELAERLKMTKQGAYSLLKRLQARGMIVRGRGGRNMRNVLPRGGSVRGEDAHGVVRMAWSLHLAR